MGPLYIASTKLAAACLAAIFAVEVYQAATRPIGAGEAYLYDRFVRPTARQVLAQELPNRDVLYALLEKRSVGLFHVSPFAVRLPGLLFAILYSWAVWRLSQLFLGAGRMFLAATVAVGILPLQWDCFSRADGVGTALALQLYAVSLLVEHLMCNQTVKPIKLNLAGACLGLSVAARLDFAIPAVVAGCFFLAAMALQGRWALWIDRLLVPAMVVTLIFLVLPLSHAHATGETTPELIVSQAGEVQSLLRLLRASAGSDRIRIAASASMEPIVNFYRAQHRATTWERAVRDFSQEHFDYCLLPESEAGLIDQHHLIVLRQDRDFLLARRSSDAM